MRKGEIACFNFSFSHNVFHSFISLACQNVVLCGNGLKEIRHYGKGENDSYNNFLLCHIVSNIFLLGFVKITSYIHLLQRVYAFIFISVNKKLFLHVRKIRKSNLNDLLWPLHLESFITHSHTMTPFDAHGKQAFWKYCGKRRNCS